MLPSLPRLDLTVDDPYHEYFHSFKLLHEYIDTGPNAGDPPSGVPGAPDLHRLGWRLGRKPILCLFGEFDAGKTTFANAMLGEDLLPTGFQPTTRLPTYVISINQRPPWLADNVGVFSKGFDLTRLQEKDHSKQFLITSGETELLQRLNEADSEPQSSSYTNVQNLVLFSDAPILSACNILDLPGYDNEEEETNRAESANVIADIAIYLSPINGFLKSQDLLRLGHLIRLLPVFPFEEKNTSELHNIYIVSTHIRPSISTSEMDSVFARACDRAWRHLAKPLQDRSSNTLVKAHLRARFYSFWDHQGFGVDQLTDDLSVLLRKDFPIIWNEVAEREISRMRSDVLQHLSEELRSYSKMISDLRSAKAQFDELKRREPENRRKIANARLLVSSRIPDYRKSNTSDVSKIFRRIIAVKDVEELIRSQFPQKKDAQENAAAFLIEEFRHQSDAVVRNSSEEFAKDVEAYLGVVEFSFLDSDIGKFSVGVPFNVKGVFQGALAGVAGTGALAIWSSLAFGNSFGFYVLTAKFVSVLSAFGISIGGGTASVIGAIGVIGAPLVFGVALVVIGGLLGWIFGKSWQKRLAEKIRDEFQNQGVLESYLDGVESFWKETSVAFGESCNKLEEARSAQIENLRNLLFDRAKGREAIEESMARVEEYRDFFAGVRWSSKT